MCTHTPHTETCYSNKHTHHKLQILMKRKKIKTSSQVLGLCLIPVQICLSDGTGWGEREKRENRKREDET